MFSVVPSDGECRSRERVRSVGLEKALAPMVEAVLEAILEAVKTPVEAAVEAGSESAVEARMDPVPKTPVHMLGVNLAGSPHSYQKG